METLLHKSSSPINKMEHRDVDKESTDSNKDEAGKLMRRRNSPQANVLHTPGNVDTVAHKNKEMHYAQKYFHKFRTVVLVVQVIRNLNKIYRDYAASRAEPMSFIECAGATTETSNLLFDRTYFKAKWERIISSEAQTVLSSPPSNRTSDGIKLAMLSLQATVASYAGYPIHVQEKLASVGWYECFGPGRVIIRQGHVPQNFFLILSGTAVVTRVSVNKKTGELYSKTVAILRKGKYFGDVAILTSSRRNVTVVCHDSVTLLAVSREDFLNILELWIP
ncbi:uncharacterized protein LOC115091938 isoform X1 [Rhinatrema bivittatum]|uniref:uncharacterized protein LOC115091938 isoform X1 n=1 Tax=Rhinatrema bivittatum TaxID=194408 RepID=UPI00112BCD76|nr:uncharacterized protein LOC115091938 isoform X1 [Rhinatrema bivittatum]